ncbi:hypothetical protein PMI42_02586 [Bradyrhizobium sp. YR681]|uniref:hypothetical protein n=1 Tax=Bradyrhizobium sp. YR681 TaxID=1144344 RepID=UPI000270DF3E|nr:hypothetical protein [Bradyrhizobium sp. YR681]EJN13844.1 hypothetical protein PMI42_02586 [Bradyrhizobium sp. YR681]
MAKGTSAVLIFEKKHPTFIVLLPYVFVIAAVCAAGFISNEDKGDGLIFLLLLAFFWIAYKRTTVQIDLRTRRLQIFRRLIGPWIKTVVDCPLDQCRALGRIEYETDGHVSYGVYVELVTGRRHDIPIQESTIQEAGRVAARLSDATGIPRLDTKF